MYHSKLKIVLVLVTSLIVPTFFLSHVKSSSYDRQMAGSLDLIVGDSAIISASVSDVVFFREAFYTVSGNDTGLISMLVSSRGRMSFLNSQIPDEGDIIRISDGTGTGMAAGRIELPSGWQSETAVYLLIINSGVNTIHVEASLFCASNGTKTLTLMIALIAAAGLLLIISISLGVKLRKIEH